MTHLKLCVLAAAAALAGCSPSFAKGPLPGAPENATFLDVDGAHVRFEDRGEGPAVVLLHGFASSLETWTAVVPELAKKHRVLTLDLKGFGWTDRPEGDYSPPAQAQLVLDLMKARGIEKADVVAHSWGSSIALQMAMRAPERVTSLALYDAWVYEEQLPTFFLWARADGLGEAMFSLWYDERSDERIAYGFYDQERYVTEDLVEAVERSLQRPGTVAAALAATRGQRFSEWQAKYATIQQRTLLLWGREDQVTLPAFGERLAKDLPHAKLVLYPLCGHFPMIEQASASTADLVEFLEAGAPQQPAAPKTDAK
ncbi:MAG: alpha/beta fold hydrolase [Polyangiales bacterium]